MKPDLHKMAVLSLAVLLAALCFGCGPKAEVKTFDVAPLLVCAGDPAQMKWDVVGRASLRETRSPTDFAEQPIASTGSKSVTPASSTTYTITALDANRANGNWRGEKTVDVANLPNDPSMADAPCDPSSRKCKGDFTINAPETVHVARVSLATATRFGKDQKATLGVTHGTWRQTIAPDQTVTVDLPATGKWTLDYDLGPNDPTNPPFRLSVKLDFACHH